MNPTNTRHPLTYPHPSIRKYDNLIPIRNPADFPAGDPCVISL